MKTSKQFIRECIASIIFQSTNLSFYAWLLINSRLVEDPTVPLVAVSLDRDKFHVNFHYNNDWIQKVEKAELIPALLHESIHIAHKHMTRHFLLDAKNPLSNIAMDVVVNHHLEKTFLKEMELDMPEYYVTADKVAASLGLDKLPIYHWTYEEVYTWLEKNIPPPPECNSLLTLKPHGDHSKWTNESQDKSDTKKAVVPSLSQDDIETMENILDNQIKDAGRQVGNLPAGIERLLKKAQASKVCWEQHLESFLASSSRSRRTFRWSRPHRFRKPLEISGSLVYPTPGQAWESEISVGVVVDTSGSVSDDLMAKFFQEIEAIAEIKELYVAEVDAALHRTYKYEPGDYNQIDKVQGRGGTNMDPGLEYFTLENHVDVIIVLTDGFLFNYPMKVNTQTLWCIPSNGGQTYLQNEQVLVLDNE